MAHDVFISHARDDKTIADAICATLEREGVRCWVAPRDIRPGAEWSEAIIEGIKLARVFVLVFSSRTNASGHVRREVERAVNHGLIVVPFRIEDVLPEGALEYHLGAVHWLDAMTPPLEAHVKRLVEIARSILGPDDKLPGSARPAFTIERPIASASESPTDPQPRRESSALAEPAISERPAQSIAGLPVSLPRFGEPAAIPALPTDSPFTAKAPMPVRPEPENPASVATFGYLIGSEGPVLNWSRALIFLTAMLVSDIAETLQYVSSYSDSWPLSEGGKSLCLALVESASALFAFRYLPWPIRAIVVTSARLATGVFFYEHIDVDWKDLFWFSASVLPFYVAMPWSVRRLRPTGRALWTGAIVAVAVEWIAKVGFIRLLSITEMFADVLKAGVFVLAFTVGLRILDGARSK